MREWRTPELVELKAKWTQNVLGADGNDSYGEAAMVPGFGEVELGSGCCC